MNNLSLNSHYVYVLNPELYMFKGKLSSLIICIDYLILQLVEALPCNDTPKTTIITVSSWNAPTIFREVKEELIDGKYESEIASLKLTNYSLMGSIIPSNNPFMFEDGKMSIS